MKDKEKGSMPGYTAAVIVDVVIYLSFRQRYFDYNKRGKIRQKLLAAGKYGGNEIRRVT